MALMRKACRSGPPTRPPADESMIFGDTIAVQPKVNKITLDFFDRFNESLRAPRGQSTGGGN